MKKRLSTRRIAAAFGALFLSLAMAAPAGANEKVLIPEFSGQWGPFEEAVSYANGWDFQCAGPIYYGGHGKNSLWLTYKDGLTEAQQKPEGVAWPWIRGRAVAQGLDYFSSGAGKSGKVIAGKWRIVEHHTRHHLGTPGDPNDLESWRLTVTGKNWGIQAPGYGTVFHVSGRERGTLTVIEQVPGPFDPIEYEPDHPERWHQGNVTFDVEALCAYFGLDVAP